MDWLNLLVAALIAVGGFIAATYEVIAVEQASSVGRQYRSNGILSLAGGVVTFGAIVLSAFINPWWTIFIVFFLAWLFGQIIIVTLRSFAQIVAPLLILTGIILLFSITL